MKVIKSKNVEVKLPIQSTVFWYLVIDYFNAPEWVLGAYIAIYSIIWISTFIVLYHEEKVDLFDEIGEISKPVRQSKFIKKLQEAMNKTKEN